MKTVTGPTERIVVVGAGLSGLAAALYLRGAGRTVTVLERDDHPGGRVGRYRGPDYEIDSGATVLTLPELIDEALAAVGHTRETVRPPLRVHRLAPGYHARFADGATVRVFADPDRTAAEIDRVAGPEAVRGYLRLRDWLARVYRAEYGEFMDTNFDSPLDMIRQPAKRAALLDLIRLGGFGRLGPTVTRYLRDPRLVRLFTFQALYAGMPPAEALAVYGAIPHMDTSLGVYFPEGGMRAVTAAMADAFTAAGGDLRLNTEVAGRAGSDSPTAVRSTATSRSSPPTSARCAGSGCAADACGPPRPRWSRTAPSPPTSPRTGRSGPTTRSTSARPGRAPSPKSPRGAARDR